LDIKGIKGFTLVELLIVVIVLSVLTGVAVPTYLTLNNRTKESATETEMRGIASMLGLYDTQNQGYPLTEDGLESLESSPDFKNIPIVDKWERAYVYTSDGDDYELRSSGVDGVLQNDDDIVFSNGRMTELGAYNRGQDEEQGPLTSLGSTYTEIISGIISLIQDFYDENERYPRSWGDYVFTDIGLDPEEWQQPYDHIIYKPGGNRVSLCPEDNYAFTVQDLEGNTRTLSYSLNWNLVYSMDNGIWYYHSIEEGNEIDISTLEVIED